MDPWKFWTAEQIAQALGSPQANVEAHWPNIVNALGILGIYDRPNALGVLATIAVEDREFIPIHEYGTRANWEKYDGGADYAGRGFIQLTHLYNYVAAGKAIGVDLAGNPDLALDPVIAAQVLSWYWNTHGVTGRTDGHWYSLPELCREPDWVWVRKVVNGGTTGFDLFLTVVLTLDAIKGPTVAKLRTTDVLRLRDAPTTDGKILETLPKGTEVETLDTRAWRHVRHGEHEGWVAEDFLEEPVTMLVSPWFDPDYPVTDQQHQWDCAQQSLWWVLHALGRKPDDRWMEDELLKAGIETEEWGLMDASGARIAAWVIEQYQPDLTAHNIPDLSFDEALGIAGTTGLMVGGRNWYDGGGHWVAVRRGRGDTLELANPGGQFSAHYGEQSLDRQAWEAKGPWSGVVVDRKA
jgi:hypothetical protein